jgi:MoaA/NifB/PqqE/SkfB family radical SAM enzyme
MLDGGNIFDLPAGLYLTNHMLEGYDSYEELGHCTNHCFFCCDIHKKYPGTDPASFIKRNPGENDRIFLCGREPTGLDRLFETLAYLESRYRSVSIATNGMRLNDSSFAERLAQAGVDELFISLHGHEAAIHDRVTRVAGSFDATVEGIRQAMALVAAGQARWRVAINSVLSRSSLPHLESLLRYVQGLGIDALCFSSLLPLGRGQKAFSDEIIPYAELLAALAHVGGRFERADGELPLRLFLLHVPFCAAPLGDGSPFTLLLTATPGEFGSLVSPANRRRCAGCRVDAYCEGVFDVYADRFGFDEFDMTALKSPRPTATPAQRRAEVVQSIVAESRATFCTSVDGKQDEIPDDLSHLSFFRLDPALQYRFFYYYDTNELLQYSRLITESSILIRCGDIECINAIIPLFYFFYGFMPPLNSYRALHPLSSQLQAKMHFSRLTGDDDGLIEPLLAVSTALEVTDGHVVFGPEDMIENALNKLLAQRYSPCIFSHSCINKVIGTDMEGIISRVAEQNWTKIVHDCNIGIDQFHRDVARVYDECFREEAAPKPRRPRSVNLVGFDNNQAVRELAATLELCGLSINEICVPDVDRRSMEALGSAELQVLNPVDGYEQIYQSLFYRLEIPTIMPSAPYGFAASRSWLGEVTRHFDLDLDTHEAFAREFSVWKQELSELTSRAAAYRIGMVLAPADIETLLRPSVFFYAIPVLELLEEMGFSIDFLVTRAADPEAARVKLATLLREPERHDMTFVSTLRDTRTWLRDTPCQCVYSDVKNDPRLARAGKAGFSLFLFEMGFGGFARSLNRLLNLCGTSFYDDYRDFRKRRPRPLALG